MVCEFLNMTKLEKQITEFFNILYQFSGKLFTEDMFKLEKHDKSYSIYNIVDSFLNKRLNEILIKELLYFKNEIKIDWINQIRNDYLDKQISYYLEEKFLPNLDLINDAVLLKAFRITPIPSCEKFNPIIKI